MHCVVLGIPLCSQASWAEPVQDLIKVMGRQVVTTAADMFYCAPQAYIDEGLQDVCGEKGVSTLAWYNTLCPGAKKRLAGYREQAAKRIAQGRTDANATLIFDLDQNPVKRGRVQAGRMLPTLTGHFTLWNDSLERPLLALEALLAQGHRAIPEVAGSGAAASYVDLIRTGHLSYAQARTLAGNGWHLPSFGAITIFALASIEFQTATSLPQALGPGAAAAHKKARIASQGPIQVDAESEESD